MADDEKPVTAEPYKLQFNYIKGPNYHEVVCSGVFGGPTPQGKMWLAFYAERTPLPRILEYHVPPPSPGKTTIEFDERSKAPDFVEARNGIIRHVECSVYMDLQTAERLQEWLAQTVAQMKVDAKK
jgi:hypothetical protein